MNPDFATYAKASTKGFVWSLIFPLIIYFLVKDKSFIYLFIIFDILGFITGYYKYKDQLAYQRKLKTKGLTIEDLANIKFVKDWEDIRKKGPVKYSLIDGGIFFGFAMSLLISLITVCVIKDLMAYISGDLNNMFNFIGYTYLAGALAGIIIYRFLWANNEQKFIRLTDPLH